MAAHDKNGLGNVRIKGSRLSLRNQKQLSDISPAPVPRSSHRIRNGNVDSEDKSKNNSLKRGQNSVKSAGVNVSNHSENAKLNGIEHKENSNGTQFNGYNVAGRAPGICPLSNLGNTCFLNSVLYALRFLPGFAHDLHHLHSYLQLKCDQEFSHPLSSRFKCLTELHNVFNLLWSEEHSSVDGKRIPALQPLQFLESVRSLNPQFEGNQQQDAHELLHWLLDQLNCLPQDVLSDAEADKSQPKAKRRKRNRQQQRELDYSKSVDVVGSKFVGRMSLETRCAECEQTNGREECFLELCVPVKTKAEFDDDDEMTDVELLLNALCIEDSLVGSNKYFCEFCAQHNEAQRFVHFKDLPHNLVIHVKRFSSYASRTSTTKCCDAMPAPFKLPCFCQVCMRGHVPGSETGNGKVNGFSHSAAESGAVDQSGKSKPFGGKLPPSDHHTHLPYYLRAFVCHLGATISSGHYISFIHVTSRSYSCGDDKHAVNAGKRPSTAPSAHLDGVLNGSSACTFLSCCSNHLDKVLAASPNPSLKEGGVRSQGSPEEGYWLECDDEKIKVVSFADVSSAMNSNIITPYLLFYSR